MNVYFFDLKAFTNVTFFLQNQFPLSFLSVHDLTHKKGLIYYTIITFKTTGYGDVIPQTPAAKDLANSMPMNG